MNYFPIKAIFNVYSISPTFHMNEFNVISCIIFQKYPENNIFTDL